jgi:hypothetical protein
MLAVEGRMARERVQTRADADTVSAIEEYAEEKEISESEAVRRLIRSGLSLHGYEVPGRHSQARFNANIRAVGGAVILILLVLLTLAEFGLI